jgi:hypothetical protein
VHLQVQLSHVRICDFELIKGPVLPSYIHIVTCYCEVSLAMWHQNCVTQQCYFLINVSSTLLCIQQCACRETFLELRVVDSGLIKQSIVEASVVQFSVLQIGSCNSVIAVTHGS